MKSHNENKHSDQYDLIIDENGDKIIPLEKQKIPKEDNVLMDLEGFGKYCRGSKRPELAIIADYAEEKQLAYTHKIQWQSFIKRNVRAAQVLIPYTDKQREEAMKKIYASQYISKWTLETLIKYLE